ncbi:unnamed protein product [Tenebrio molitor]|nr:unnamed protein product [Tenebrio molitor]
MLDISITLDRHNLNFDMGKLLCSWSVTEISQEFPSTSGIENCTLLPSDSDTIHGWFKFARAIRYLRIGP